METLKNNLTSYAITIFDDIQDNFHFKNTVEDIFSFMTKNFGDSDAPTEDYKQNRKKIDKDLSLIKKQASNLKKLIPSDMQKMLKSIQSAMGIQGTPIKTNGSETESNLNKITKDIVIILQNNTGTKLTS